MKKLLLISLLALMSCSPKVVSSKSLVGPTSGNERSVGVEQRYGMPDGIPALLPLPKVVEFTGRWVKWPAGDDLVPEITVRRVDSIPGVRANVKEAYRLSISREGILIECISDEGEMNASKTLAQLSSSAVTLPEGTITDWPSFRVRGWMLDCGRTYVSIPELKREIDILSGFKLNVFHWHLTDNQAFRLESRRYPQLNDPETMTRQKGLYYTQEEARELGRYCRERGVVLIPEIDVPGHSAYFDRAFGFGMQTAEGKAIVKELLEEVCEVFDSSPYIHIGSDEVVFTDPSFVPEIVALVRSRGKKVVAWNPGWRFAPGDIDMTQLWSYRGTAQEGIPAIDCRFHYINHFDAYGDIVGLHTSRIYGVDEGSEDIAGAVVALWNDRHLPDASQMLLQNNFYPSAIALADRAWRGGGYQYFDDFGVALPPEGPVHEDFADFERRMTALGEDIPLHYLPQADERWLISEPFPNGGDLGAVFAPETGQYDWSKATVAAGSGIYLRHVWGELVPAHIPHPQPFSTVYARQVVHAESEEDALLLFETQNYSRSERDLPPPQGQWDWRGSWIRINGEAVDPPEWTPDLGREDIDSPMGNENAASRPLLRIHLRKGDNEILLKLPVGAFTTPETRLVKWMFTCRVVRQ